MAKPTAPTHARVEKHIPPLPGGLVQHREGIERCGGCQREVVIGRTIDGILIELSCVLGNRHTCNKGMMQP